MTDDLRPVLHAAMALVAADGLRGLSLRPLAERLGSTVSALTHRFGLKDELLAALVDAAIAEEAAFLDRWLARIRAIGPRDGALTADLADAVLEDMTGPEALRTRFYSELLQGVVARPEIAPLLADWSNRRLAFWRAATEGQGHAELGDVLHAFSINEAAYGLAVGDVAAYRWLRRLNLRRLCGDLVPGAGAADLKQFEVFRAALGELLETPGAATPPLTEWQARVAPHISALIIAEGADAVTHRAIAARAGLANSTLAYHFPRQEDLLRAGLSDIAGRVGRVFDPAPGQNAPVFELTAIEAARATFALSLVAARMPNLKGVVADLRRRRGDNNVVYLERQMGRAYFDILSAQALSVAGMGRLMLEAGLDAAASDAALKLTEAIRADAVARL